MQTFSIQCPHCSAAFALDQVMSHQMRDAMRKEFEAEARKLEKTLQEREAQLGLKEKEIQQAKLQVSQEIQTRLNAEKAKLIEEAKKWAASKLELELKDLKQQNEEKEKQLKGFVEQELELRKKQRELEEQAKNLQLEMLRKLDEERQKIQETTLKAAEEAHRLKELEKDKLIQDFKVQIEELKRKAEQGSQQTQGEILELELETLLKNHFPHDVIESVGKGVRGADLLQKVYTPLGQYCGTIIWESKNTKAWQDGWLQKLKDDQREAKAEIAVLLTTVLPKGKKTFCDQEGIWITPYECGLSLAAALRQQLVEVAHVRRASVGKNEKIEALYQYFSGREFSQRIKGIVETHRMMTMELEQEKRVFQKVWAKREKQLERIIQSSTRIQGDLEGILGAEMPQLDELEFKALEGPEEEKENEVLFS